MKRVTLSLYGGILLPFLYFVLLIILINAASLFFRFTGRDSALHAWAEAVEPIIVLPISWASYIYFYYFPPDPDFAAFTGFELGNIISLMVGNFLLYAILSYTILWMRTRRVKSKFV